ncbi:uncharacterized protein DDB_G0290685 [Pangasianodon hypophthalmus]|uniref:uncharacterized protein DDB_G0290685 n=1 Tax=Pangasianodon hypophthalmus TaxID=310915 RepID=UPI002307B5A6|nr:uncharacterized protein DDB_G0290685 [Pangasianodon hypophthalmus]
MKMAKKKQRFQLILMGEEWTGKSSAGNTMLGQTVFKVDSDTEHVIQCSGVIEGKHVSVVDTPGWDPRCSPDVPLKMLKKGLSSASLMCQGFHVLLLTIPISQNLKWNQKVAQRLSNALRLFNDDIWKHTMLLFTRADLLHSTGLEEYLKGSGRPFQSLVEKCERRHRVLNNHKGNDHKQVRELLEKIEQMVQENNGQSLQLVTSEQEVGTLRQNRQLVERCSKLEEHIGRESCFRLEEYMFKSLSPEENDPPNPTEQNELPEENSTCILQSKSEMSHPDDVQDAAFEYNHIQDEDTESTSDLCSESPAEINRDLGMSSDDDGDTETSDVDQTEKNTCTEVEETGVDRIPGDEEKSKKHLQHSTLQKNTPRTWDNSWDLSITCYFYSDVSNHQQNVVMTCVLQVSVCWRKMKPSYQTDWISFTVCGDNWLFIMVLCLFVRYLCLINKTSEISKETSNQTMNTLVSGSGLSKENQAAFDPLLWHNGNNRPQSLDGEITQCIKMKDADEDEELSQYIHKGEDDDDEDDEEQSQQIIGANEEIPHQSKRGDNEIPQHDCNEFGENILQQRKSVDDDHALILTSLQRSINEDEKQILQNNGRDYEETDQQSNIDEGEEILKLNRMDDDISRISNRRGSVKKTRRKTKTVEYEKTHKYSTRGHKEKMPQHHRKGNHKEIPQQSKRHKDEEISKDTIEDMEEIPQNNRRGDKKEIPQCNTRDDEQEIPQNNTRGDKKEIPQNKTRGDQKGIPQNKTRGDQKEIPQNKTRGDKKEIPQNNTRGDQKGIPQNKTRGDKKEIPQNKTRGDKKEIPQNNRRGDKKEIPQNKTRGEKEISQDNRRGDKKEIPQNNRRAYEEEIPQNNRRGDKKEIPQNNRRGDKKEIPQNNRRGDKKEIPQNNRRGDKKEIPTRGEKEILQVNRRHYEEEIPQCNRDRDNEEIPKHSRRTDNEEIHCHKRKGDDGDTYQHLKSACDHEKIPRYNSSGLDDEIPPYIKREDGKELPQQRRKRDNDEIPQYSRKGNEKEIPQHTSVGDDEEIKETPEQQVEGIVKIRSANKKIHHKWHRDQQTKDLNNFAGTKDEEKNTNRIHQVERRQQSPEARAASSSKLNHKGLREAEQTLAMRRVESGGTRKLVRSQSMDFLYLRYAGAEDTRQHGGMRKMKRTKSLERFIVFNMKEEKTAVNKALPKS